MIPFATMTAFVMDVLYEWRARRRLGALVNVWPLHSVQLVDAATRALADRGITCHVRGVHHRLLLHIFGPYVSLDVLVPPEKAAEATEVLRDLFDPSDLSAKPAIG